MVVRDTAVVTEDITVVATVIMAAVTMAAIIIAKMHNAKRAAPDGCSPFLLYQLY